jgi:two-component system, chemotaxis family, CheB/CheR fusion protein
VTDTSTAPPRVLSVLLIEDNPDLVSSLAMYFKLCGGFAVSVAADGEAGVKMAFRDAPDAVVCDLGLPRKNGLNVAREIIQGLAVRPLMIAVTAYAGMEEQARDAGFDHFLIKPADPAELEALLRAHRDRLAAGGPG